MTSQPKTAILAIPSAGTYLIDGACSVVTYTSRHMFGLGKVRATFGIAGGVLEVGPTLADSGASVTIPAGSFASDNARRDRDVKGPGLLDVANFPLIEFTSTAAREDGHGIVLMGIVDMHGVTVPVQLQVASWQVCGPDRIQTRARAEHLDRYMFGITAAKGLVGRYFDLDLDVTAVLGTGS